MNESELQYPANMEFIQIQKGLISEMPVELCIKDGLPGIKSYPPITDSMIKITKVYGNGFIEVKHPNMVQLM